MRFSLKLLFWVSTLAVLVAASFRIRGEAGTLLLSALALPFVVPPQMGLKRWLLSTLATWSLILTAILSDKNFDFTNQVSSAFVGVWILVGIPLSATWTMAAMILTSLAEALWLGNNRPIELVVDSGPHLSEDGNRESNSLAPP
jgi:hypothetical protein